MKVEDPLSHNWDPEQPNKYLKKKKKKDEWDWIEEAERSQIFSNSTLQSGLLFQQF